MVMIGNRWALAMMLLISFPVVSWCEEDPYNSMLEDSRVTDRITDFTDLKRDSSIEQDDFVGLMGRRSAGIGVLPSQKRGDMGNVFVGLLGRRSPGADPRPKPARSIYIQKGRLRFQRGI